MSFSSINIQGNIVSSEILDKIRSEEKFKHQSPEAFGLARNASLRDEIGMAWSIMRTHWQAYKKRLETLPKGDTGTSLTREKLILPLLTELGYEVGIQKAQQINGKSYAISHGATNRDQFPVHVMGYNDNLDKRRDSGGPRLSPHALVQEYLNNTEHLYALVTNGRQLRLLRDATRLVRMSYLEFDLERMFEEELYADFSLLFRLLHVSRMPEKIDTGSDAVIEYYHQESMASGTRIREKLSEAVEISIKTLANGFLENKKNEGLIALFESNSLSADSYYMHQLRLIYRILFLIVLEERKLVYGEELYEEQQRFRDIYYRYYSIERLRKLTENRVYVDADKYDLWESLKTTFLLFEQEQYGSKIGIKPLGSGLFAPNALGTLKEQYLNNGDLIEVLKRLTTFVNEQGQLVRVNYSDLDVEEFGSIYEGLLEYDPVVEKIGAKYQFSFVLGDDRSSSGSHYTPEELVKPLIKHSLDYIIEDKLKDPNPEEALLSITVCDVACGSGHILLSAARKIATELASIREGAEQPSPTYYRAAIKDVIRHCIYGVDLNPLAVELCKVALWLEAHNPNEPLNFLDHHIKCGNAIVGLAHFQELENGIATEAFKTLPGDDKTLAAEYKKRNTLERKTTTQLSTYDLSKADDSLKGLRKEFADFVAMSENTPEEITQKEKAYKTLTEGKKWYRLKNLADLQVAQFFIPKTLDNKEMLTTDAKYRTYLNAGTQILDRGASMAVATEKKFFHWFLEFPQVFSNGGFECILGNPPFLGGADISKKYGLDLTNFLYDKYPPARNRADLVTYFVRRISMISKIGFSFISTNSIAEGDTRIGGLETIIKENNFIINHAVRSTLWPGIANLFVSLVSMISKESKAVNRVLDGGNVDNINGFLKSGENEVAQQSLKQNSGKVYLGCKLLGDGFLIDKFNAQELFLKSEENHKVVKPILNGRELGQSSDPVNSDFAINFQNWPIEKAMRFKEVFAHVEEFVKPERDIQKDKLAKESWWRYARSRQELYSKLKNKNSCFVWPRTSKYLSIQSVSSNTILTDGVCVFVDDNFSDFAVMQSTIHYEWANKYSSKLKNDLRYSNSDAFDSFPFPIERGTVLDKIGCEYLTFRQSIIKSIDLGVTKTYNQFHNHLLVGQIDFTDAKAFEKRYGKETWNLYNHLEVKKEGNISYEEAVPLIFKLRKLHKQMDEAVLAAYGWDDIQLHHDFHEVEYLPEHDRIRYTIHPDAGKEVLKRLLLLNYERYEAEIKQGLHKKADVMAYYKQKNEELPSDAKFSDAKTKAKKAPKPKKAKPTKNPIATQVNLGFDSPSENQVGNDSKVHIKNTDGKDFKYHLLKEAKKDAFTGDYKQIATTATLAEIMFGRKAGNKFQFGGIEYEIIGIE